MFKWYSASQRNKKKTCWFYGRNLHALLKYLKPTSLHNGYGIKRNVNSSSCILQLNKQLENNGFAKPCGKDIYVTSSAIFSGATILPLLKRRVRSRSFSRLSQGPSRPYCHLRVPSLHLPPSAYSARSVNIVVLCFPGLVALLNSVLRAYFYAVVLI